MQKVIHRSTMNPIDSVEDLLIANDWIYKRLTSEELLLTITGKTCDYNFCFNWNDATSRLTLSCEIDAPIPEGKMGEAIMLANEVNQSLSIGHYIVDHTLGVLVHRYNLLCDEEAEVVNRSYLADVVERILKECEENAGLFKYFLNKNICSDKKTLSLLMTPAEGRA